MQEMGNLIEIPFENERNSGKTMHLWTVVRVLQHMTEDLSKKNKRATQDASKQEVELNLSSEDSLSAASVEEDEQQYGEDENEEDEEADDMATRATLEMSNFKI